MKDHARNVNRLIDDGGPLLIWDNGGTSQYKKGFLINFLICDNPDCEYVHFRAFDIDERYSDFETSENGEISYRVNKHKNDAAFPDTILKGSVHIRTSEIIIDSDLKDDPDFIKRIQTQIETTDLIKVMRKRWRHVKQINRDAWRKEDWTWWRPGLLIAWFDVYPDEPNMIVMDRGKYPVVADDMYCITPGCACKDITISFTTHDDNYDLIGTLTANSRNWGIHIQADNEENYDRIQRLWENLNIQYPDLKKTLKNRRLLGFK